MFFTKHRQLIRWIIIIASFGIISLILWNTYVFFQKFKAEERIKMQNWSFAQQDIIQNMDLNGDIGNLPLKILESNTTTPMIKLNEDGSMDYNNIDEKKAKDNAYLKQLIEQFKNENKPIEIVYDGKVLSTLYYGNSPLLKKLKFYPLALLLIILLFGAVVYFFYRSSKIATQNKLWSGMAKETAHQIGTPLSSLIGWTEILKSENTNPEYILEIEKDINRLQTITERFSKIGSLPTLEKHDIVKETIDAYSYLKSRSSKLINFSIDAPDNSIYVNLNKQLYGWTIENLVKNAIDAMKGKGNLKIQILPKDKFVEITVSDTGKGISKKEFNSIFEPGFTTKKRGWGLGLSLAKRIVEDFHEGKIKVQFSEIGVGTTMLITLKTV
ncbi:MULTISPECIES: sensor histidine kinase [Mesoflavibacter]|uniref:histidine kinase n=1 Tax=Mesoflavibacter profundi TaxID=2708110 RepID=A0ABT4S0T9_9FLAO|nr:MULTISPECIES: HAMP domain-containing sensor histidine kinase [Mesoflavibacter]MDA0177687.1 HAMP domain-containing histidine kinase [Mesoflavibacter profundi]QIJ88643.1 Two-component system sensor histidine kinase [Mesoflavibacter sp. HG96]QIJ91371.1 Two-component system sensor histidine kinase [Mesoflavibacter sp. HG37]